MIASPRARVGNVEATSTERRAVHLTIIISAFGVTVTELLRKPRTKRRSLPYAACMACMLMVSFLVA